MGMGPSETVNNPAIQPGWFSQTPRSYLLQAFKAQKPSKPLVLTEKTTGRNPNFICMPNYPVHQLSCLLVHPHRRDVHTSPCSSSAHRDRAVSASVMGELHLTWCEEQTAGTSPWWAQAGHQPAFISPLSTQYLAPFFRHCNGVLAHPKVRTCDLTHL